MSREPSAETELKSVKRDLKTMRARFDNSQAELSRVRRELIDANNNSYAWRQEVLEWKKRFDALLMRTPTTEPPK